MSGGRVELGLGAGWFDSEHRAYGIAFPDTGERFERLEEQLAVITGLWSRGTSTRWRTARPCPAAADAPASGDHRWGGPRRTPALAARFADELNTPFMGPADSEAQYGWVRRACEEVGRDPSGIRFSAAVVVCCGTDAEQIATRGRAIGRDVDELRAEGACGTPEEVTSRQAEWRRAGAETIYLQVLDLSDLDHVRLIGREVAGRVSI